jgi:hypothetical protein
MHHKEPKDTIRLQLSVSCIAAYLKLCSTAKDEDIEFKKKSDPIYAHLDWHNALLWRNIFILSADTPYVNICREFCFHFILRNNILLKLSALGRDVVSASLSIDELQVFRHALLLEKIPSEDVWKWWDRLKCEAIGLRNQAQINQGRLAESWTIDREIKHIGSFTNLTPEWVSIESDRFGYDIQSYRKNNKGIVFPVQLEVKSYQSALLPQFFITRHEWETAMKLSSSYLFCVWCIETKTYHEYTVAEIETNISTDQGLGNWQSILISGLI